MTFTLQKKLFIGLFFVISFISCSKNVEKPENLISDEKMVLLLVDLHAAEAYLKNTSLGFYTVDSLQVVFYNLQKHILEQHQIDSTSFYTTYDFYLKKDLETLDKIYQAVVDTLENRAENAPHAAIAYKDDGENGEILAKIKKLSQYQDDEIHFLPNGKLYSRDPLIQSYIHQIYDIPQNMQLVQTDAKNQNLPEALVIYKKAIELFGNEHGSKIKKPDSLIDEAIELKLTPIKTPKQLIKTPMVQ